jgi:hypothetical protein
MVKSGLSGTLDLLVTPCDCRMRIAHNNEERIMPRRRPTLLQTAARTAVITKTATTVAGNSAQKQAAAAAAAAPAAAPVAAPAANDDVIAKIERLAALHASGALTDEEFAALKMQAIG